MCARKGSRPPAAAEADAQAPTVEDSVDRLAGVGPRRAELLGRLELRTIRDLLYFFPYDWFDRSNVCRIKDVQPGQTATLLVRVRNVRLAHTRLGKRAVMVTFEDDTGSLQSMFFHREYLARQLAPGTSVLLSGALRWYDGLRMAEPEFEILTEEEETPAAGGGGAASGGRLPGLHTLGIVPHYHLTDGLPEKWLRTLMRSCIDRFAGNLVDPLPPALRRARGYPALAEAIHDIHFPPSIAARDAAVRRFAAEELLHLQCLMAIRRRQAQLRPATFSLRVDAALDARIRARFPFALTAAQDRAVADLCADLARPSPMNRLLQGDVGSGKTAVAVYAALATIAAGHQVALMAPTELLARQHADGIARLLEGSRVRLALLVGKVARSARQALLDRLFAGEIDLIIGTHALIEEDVAFHSLGLAVIDEQHRFGVLQRAVLRRKGAAPHVLIMTATPIPRTLAMTVFGDLDHSLIDELPPGRKPVRTLVRNREAFPKAMDFVRDKLRQGRQAYFIYPLIDDSPELNLRSATAMFRDLSTAVFPEFRVELLTGITPAADKERIMTEFRSGAIMVLVSTVVIEVGIDVPNATLLVVDHADRFGLAQLHQLRGRVGRGAEQSYCILFADDPTEEGERRLRVLEECTDGFRIAEADLGFRGSGELLGLRQSGLPEFKVARLERDFTLLQDARADATHLLSDDPRLLRPEHAALRAVLCARYQEVVQPLAGE